MLTTEGPSVSSAAVSAAGNASRSSTSTDRSPGNIAAKPGAQPARPEPVVAVVIAVELLLTRDAHRVRMVVEQQEGDRQPVLQRGVNLHAVHEE